jgi:hypothetical protein
VHILGVKWLGIQNELVDYGYMMYLRCRYRIIAHNTFQSQRSRLEVLGCVALFRICPH